MTWIQTAHRRRVDLLNPDAHTIVLPDIIHALSQICRYTGHTQEHYSVAEHSCLVSDWLAANGHPELALAGLLHDAPEAYCGDPSYPLQMALPPEARAAIKAMHERVWLAISKRFGLEACDIHHPLVKDADRRILLDECDALLGGPVVPWAVHGVPLGVKIGAWPFERARNEFLSRWMALRHPEGISLRD